MKGFLESDPTVNDTALLDVSVPLELFTGGLGIKLSGTTALHPSPSNHFIRPGDAGAELKEAGIDFFVQVGDKLVVNELSLPKGGGFDLSAKWDADITKAAKNHHSHRRGSDVDIENLDVGILKVFAVLKDVMEKHQWKFIDEGQLRGGKKFPHFRWKGG